MSTGSYAFPLGIQLTLPDAYASDTGFAHQLEILQRYGFDGVELNIIHPERLDPSALERHLTSFNLKMTYFASGAAAKAHGLSLSHQESEIRKKSVDRCRAYIEFAGAMKAGIIIGFFQGGLTDNVPLAREQFRRSLEQIAPLAAERSVALLIEPLNRYLTSVTNTLGHAFAVIEDLDDSVMRILPDTFHMNIEEKHMVEPLERYEPYYESVHLSDNNRYWPGLGAIDFAPVVDYLKRSDYKGGIAFEGNIESSFEQDLRQTMDSLGPML